VPELVEPLVGKVSKIFEIKAGHLEQSLGKLDQLKNHQIFGKILGGLQKIEQERAKNHLAQIKIGLGKLLDTHPDICEQLYNNGVAGRAGTLTKEKFIKRFSYEMTLEAIGIAPQKPEQNPAFARRIATQIYLDIEGVKSNMNYTIMHTTQDRDAIKRAGNAVAMLFDGVDESDNNYEKAKKEFLSSWGINGNAAKPFLELCKLSINQLFPDQRMNLAESMRINHSFVYSKGGGALKFELQHLYSTGYREELRWERSFVS